MGCEKVIGMKCPFMSGFSGLDVNEPASMVHEQHSYASKRLAAFLKAADPKAKPLGSFEVLTLATVESCAILPVRGPKRKKPRLPARLR